MGDAREREVRGTDDRDALLLPLDRLSERVRKRDRNRRLGFRVHAALCVDLHLVARFSSINWTSVFTNSSASSV